MLYAKEEFAEICEKIFKKHDREATIMQVRSFISWLISKERFYTRYEAVPWSMYLQISSDILFSEYNDVELALLDWEKYTNEDVW